MAIKSIVDISIADGEFTKFKAAFDQYSETLKKQPGAWDKVSKTQASAATAMERIASAASAQTEAASKNDEKDKVRLQRLTDSEKAWGRMATYSNAVYHSALNTGTALLRWGGAIAGIATGVGLFGFDKLANNIAGVRQSAMALPNTSPAQLQAFGTNFGRVVDTSSLLSQMAQMETNPAQATAWYELMGGRRMTGNTTQDALAFLNAERQFAIQHKGNLALMAQAYQLPTSFPELQRLANTGDKEWAGLQAGNAADVRRFGMTNQSALAWQNFSTQMQRNWTTLLDRLGGALGGLTGPLSRLSTGFTNLAVKLLDSPAVKGGIDAIAKWLNGFSNELDTKAFDQKLKNFTSDAGVLADGIHMLALVLKAPGKAYAGYKNIFDWLGDFAGKARSIDQGAWNVGSDLRNLFMPDPGSLLGGQAVTPNWAAQRDAGTLSSLGMRQDMAAIRAGGVPQAPAINAPALQITPLRILIENATGGSAIVTINGLAGQ